MTLIFLIFVYLLIYLTPFDFMSLPVKDSRPQTEDIKGVVPFSEMDLRPELVNSLRRVNFITATEI